MPNAIDTSVSECEALLHALSDELASADGGDAASTLLEALVRKGGSLRGMCIAMGNPSAGRIADLVAACITDMVATPDESMRGIVAIRSHLDELRRISRLASPSVEMVHLNETRRVAIVDSGGETIAVPLDAVGGAHPERSGGLRIDIGSNFGGGLIHASRLLEFAAIDRAVVDGAAVWPESVKTSTGADARFVESAADANRRTASSEAA